VTPLGTVVGHTSPPLCVQRGKRRSATSKKKTLGGSRASFPQTTESCSAMTRGYPLLSPSRPPCSTPLSISPRLLPPPALPASSLLPPPPSLLPPASTCFHPLISCTPLHSPTLTQAGTMGWRSPELLLKQRCTKVIAIREHYISPKKSPILLIKDPYFSHKRALRQGLKGQPVDGPPCTCFLPSQNVLRKRYMAIRWPFMGLFTKLLFHDAAILTLIFFLRPPNPPLFSLVCFHLSLSDSRPRSLSPSLLPSSCLSSAPHHGSCKAVDLFAVGCIMHYVLANGQHAFGEWIERDSNIVRDRPDTRALSFWSRASLGVRNDEPPCLALPCLALPCCPALPPCLAAPPCRPASWPMSSSC